MIGEIGVDGFKGVPYLETSPLMQAHAGRLVFSRTAPNVVVGPNGSGKSALLNTLAIRFLTWFSDRSTLDRRYVLDVDSRDWWSRSRERREEPVWLQGLHCQTGHIPGNELSIGHAMMGVYWEQAQEYARLIERKSSGQQNQAVLEQWMQALEGRTLPSGYEFHDWEFGTEPGSTNRLHTFGYGREAYARAEVLKALYRPAADAVPLVLMDEPEQSLDTRAEGRLWSAMARADCGRMQIIVATHSLYPMLHHERFHLIETQPGYVKEVLELMA
jgi:hypothetical protein